MPPRKGKEKLSNRQPRIRLSRQARREIQTNMASLDCLQQLMNWDTSLAPFALQHGLITQAAFDLNEALNLAANCRFDDLQDLLGSVAGEGSGEQPENPQEASSQDAEAPTSRPSGGSSGGPAEEAVAGSSRSTGRRTSGDPPNNPSGVPDKPTAESSQGHSRSSSESEDNNPELRRAIE